MGNYVIKDSGTIFDLTDIGRIGIVKRSGDEWSTFVKKFELTTLPDFAAVRFDSQGVSGLHINGEFVEGNPGKYCNRITYAECTSRLSVGENEIKFVLGGSFYQPTNDAINKRRGSQFSFVSAELEYETAGERHTVKTDESWECIFNDGQKKPVCLSEVTKGEYERFWLSAVLIPEVSSINVPKEIAEVAGAGYERYVSEPMQKHAYPAAVVATNMTENGGSLKSVEDNSYVKYDFGRLHVGYVMLECVAEQDGEVKL